MLREAVAAGTDLGLKVGEIMEKGLLVPDELMIELVRERLTREDTENGFILDGFPRTVEQARALDETMRELSRKIDVALFVDVAEEEVVQRISSRRNCPKCGKVYSLSSLGVGAKNKCELDGAVLVRREDDEPETVRSRYRVYLEKTTPVIEHYSSRGDLVSIDGSGEIDEVTEKIFEQLETA